jgi:DNA-binding transcriptional ArsR family regulator
MADIFDTLADPTRRAVLEALREARSPVSVVKLTDLLGVSRQSLNRHLVLLREAGLVRASDDGPARSYSLALDGLAPLEEWLTPFVVAHPDSEATAYAAWAAADVADSIGRFVAESSHRLKVAAEDVVGKVEKALPGAAKRRGPRG